jgi:puromycin-sensitive aminopeptidase
MGTSEYRLSRDVEPGAYRVELTASPRRSTFDGVVVIHAQAHRPLKEVTLHCRDLKLLDCRIRQGRRRLSVSAKPNANTETVTIECTPELLARDFTLEIKYRGKLNPGMHGLYLARDGPETAIVSQCEAADARAIFPCWDEPDFKATLQWTIHTDPGLTVITNGVLHSRRASRVAPGKVTHRFRPTRRISTYLAALTIGRYDLSPREQVQGTPCRTGAGRGKLPQTQFASEVTRKVLPWYEHYFAHPYHYQKLDQIAVPGFDAGAMENVGAILYRQNLLLMDKATTSWSARKRIAEVIAHEIAHQWFGNLVTMRWWDDLWLNEAFATWIAYKAIDAWRPSWRMWDDYQESKEAALRADALVNTHPIYTPVRSPAEATELFDIITYEKGCAVLLMAERYLGAERFRAGIRRYISRFRESNATGADLWDCLGETCEEPIGRLMKSWVTQSGFPLVTLSTTRRKGRSWLRLRQERFFADRAEATRDNSQLWLIPLVVQYGTASGVHTTRLLLDRDEQEIELPGDEPIQWLYPNEGATGFYRLAFSSATLQSLLRRGLPHLNPATRCGLLQDQWGLVRNGSTSMEDFMEVLRAFHQDRDPMVVRAMVGHLRYLSEHLITESTRPRLQRFTQWIFEPQLEELGWYGPEGESPETSVRRAVVITALGEIAEDQGVLRKAARLAMQEHHAPGSVDPNLAPMVIRLSALKGAPRLFHLYTQIYLDRKHSGAPPELQNRYLAALTAFEQPALIKRVLRFVQDGTIPQEQVRTILSAMLSHRHSQLLAWKFLQKHWRSIAPLVGVMGLSRLIEATGALPATQKARLRAFFAANPVPEAKRALQKAIEAMELREELEKREIPHLTQWLKAHVPLR